MCPHIDEHNMVKWGPKHHCPLQERTKWRWMDIVRQGGWIQLYSCHKTPNTATSPSKNIRHLNWLTFIVSTYILWEYMHTNPWINICVFKMKQKIEWATWPHFYNAGTYQKAWKKAFWEPRLVFPNEARAICFRQPGRGKVRHEVVARDIERKRCPYWITSDSGMNPLK